MNWRQKRPGNEATILASMSIEPRLSVPDFVSQLWRKASGSRLVHSCTVDLWCMFLYYTVTMDTRPQRYILHSQAPPTQLSVACSIGDRDGIGGLGMRLLSSVDLLFFVVCYKHQSLNIPQTVHCLTQVSNFLYRIFL